MRSASILTVIGLLGVLAAAPAHAAGLPQLDTTTFSSQAVWLVITFVALYVLMGRVALPRIGEVLEERQNRIEDNLAKAEDLKTQAQAAAQAYEEALAKARGEAFDAIRTVKEAAAADAARRQGDLGADLAVKIKDAETGIAEAKAEALSGIREVAQDVAATVVEKLAGESVGESKIASAVGNALKARG